MYKASVVVFFVLFSAVASHEQASPVIISNYNLIDSTEPTFVSTIDPAISDEINFTTTQFIEKYGYSAETHHVTTVDGYILEIHRITGGPISPPQPGKKVVLLMHGLTDSSATWVLTGPLHGLGYALSNVGYDVWMANARGNFYSCNHTRLDPFGSRHDRERFWSFSWHEVGIYDLPKVIDHVLNVTQQEKLQYIGHSQGTTAFFVLSSERPEYNDKIEMMHALAPVAYLTHTTSPPIRALVPFLTMLKVLTRLVGFYNFSPTNEFLIMAGRNLCRDQAVTQIICENIIFLIAGYSSDQLNKTLIPVILGHAPAGAATKQFIHYGQEVNSHRFRQFDYGIIGNLQQYRQISPPDYKISNIRVPVAAYYAEDDSLSTPRDVYTLLGQLPNVIESYLVPHKKFNHIDFLWGVDAPKLLYKRLIQIMRSAGNMLGTATHDTDNGWNDLFEY